MAGLWVIILICQLYFILCVDLVRRLRVMNTHSSLTFSYSKSQVKDHKLYHSVYSENPEAFTMSILRSSRYNPGSVYNNMPPPGQTNDVWDARASQEELRDEPVLAQGNGYYDAPSPGVGHQGGYDAQGQYHDEYNEAHANMYTHASGSAPMAGTYEGASHPGQHDYIEPQGQYSDARYDTPPSYGHETANVAGYGAGGAGGYGNAHRYSQSGAENTPLAFPQAMSGGYPHKQ